LKMSASEMKCFILYSGLIFGDLVPIGNEHWKLYILLRQIVSLILSKHVTDEDAMLLKTLISEHHSILLNTFSELLKPKYHHMLHYPRSMQKVGPLVNMWCMRYESKHRLSKQSANVVASRTDISKTLAMKHQLKLCNIFLNKLGFNNTNSILSSTVVHDSIEAIVKNFDDITLRSDGTFCKFKTQVQSVKRLSINSTTYKIEEVLFIDVTDELPIFGIICNIILSADGEALFIYKKIKTKCFNEHLQAFEVEISNNTTLLCILQKHLHAYAPIVKTVTSKGAYAVSIIY
jgi:hypothetical protein